MSEVDEQKAITADAAPKTVEDQEKDAAAAELSRGKTTNGKPSMAVKIYSPFQDYYDGPAFSLSAENLTGPFDILPQHHNFISLLIACEVVIRTVDKGEQRIRISGGLIHVKADQTIIFLDV